MSEYRQMTVDEKMALNAHAHTYGGRQVGTSSFSKSYSLSTKPIPGGSARDGFLRGLPAAFSTDKAFVKVQGGVVTVLMLTAPREFPAEGTEEYERMWEHANRD